jgi:hypothetical protein
MTIYFAAMAVSGVLMAAAVDQVPTLDTRPTCAGAESNISASRTIESCQQSEQQARDSLNTQWRNFAAGDKRNCVAETNIGGYPSYVQILTCLEMARDARTMPAD